MADLCSRYLPQINSNDVAYLQYTSGSTSNPKGVIISHSNIMANLYVSKNIFPLIDNNRGLTWAPHYHDLCLLGFILAGVYFNETIILMSPVDFVTNPLIWLKALSKYFITHTSAPNFGYELCNQRIDNKDCAGLDLSNLIMAGNGGEPVNSNTLSLFSDKFKSIGFKPSAFFPCLGMAESVLFVSAKKEM